jgi:hypothetical protein
MEDTPLCPDWWPKSLWDLHFVQVPWKRPNPVNYPPPVESILSALLAHTSSYLLLDEKAALEIRTAAVKSIIEAAQAMERLHNEAVTVHAT